MKIFILLYLITVCVVAQDIEQNDDNINEVIKGYKLPRITRFNNLQLTPAYIRPRGRQLRARIAGGQNVPEENQHLFRHQVRIVAETKVSPVELSGCGGSLISDEWVLTAAHCLDLSRRISLYFGVLDDLDREFKELRNATEANWYLHPDWSRQTFRHDIALVKLIPKIIRTEQIHPIRLQRKSKKCTDYYGTHVTISGWGQSTDLYNDDSNLKYVDVNIVRNPEECAKTWSKFVDFNTMICVDASQKKGACTGDSGGPMVYTQKNGLQLLIGVTSFGTKRGCETEDHRVYTCVNGFRDWIYKVTDDPYLED